MSPTRREVLAGLSGATLAYVFQIGCAPSDETSAVGRRPARAAADPRGKPDRPGIDARDWLVVSSDGSVTVYTNRTEIGQGLTTVMHDLVGQALDLPRARINVVLGDTDLCPHDGPTSGSAATQYVAWSFWIACHQVKDDLVLLAAEALDLSAQDLQYRAGTIVHSTDPAVQMGIGELADGRVRRIKIDPVTDSASLPPYVDRQSLNVNAEAIVTGTLEYTGDMRPDGCVYGAFIAPDYHPSITKMVLANIRAARSFPGVVRVKQIDKGVVALGETYTATRKAIRAMDADWAEPSRPREFNREAEIRAGAELKYVVEEKGNVEWALEAGATAVKETYLTQYMSQVPLETDTAIASRDDGRLTVRLGTQNPFFMRYKVAQSEGIPESEIRVIAPPAGGAFGSKVGHSIAEEAASMLALTDRPVKYVYSREDDIRKLGRYKEAVVFDVTTAFDPYGRLIAREIDIYQDEGFGTEEMYEVPNVRTRLFSTPVPMKHATMRGTSYVQSIFALESHTDMVAEAIGMDPLEFRRAHTQLEAFVPLIDWCAESFDHGSYEPPEGNAIGFAMCNHGGRQLAVVGAEVHVDRDTGEVSVVRLAGAFDIGVLINRRLATNGVRGAMIWGLGAALFEEVELYGHQCFTTGLTDYRIARMSDTPPIEVEYFDNQAPGEPRGCGEVPVPPTIAAIANAVYNATGVRFYELPLTPERVKAALATP